MATQTVLLVDDEPAIRALARGTLERAGFFVIEAKDGDEAVEIARLNPGGIDVVVSDVVMPNRAGPDAVDALRELSPEIAVLFISSHAPAGTTTRGAVCLRKPFRGRQLVDGVRAALAARPQR